MNKKTKYAVVWVFFIFTVILSLLSPIIAPYTTPYISKGAEKLAPDNIKQFAKGYVFDVQNKNVENILKNTSPEIGISAEKLDTEGFLKNYVNLKLDTAKIIAYSFKIGSSAVYTVGTTTKNGGKLYNIIYQFENNDPVDKYIAVRMSIIEVGGQLQVVTIDRKLSSIPLDTSEASTNNTYDLNLFVRVLFSLIISLTAFYYLKKSSHPRWWILLVILIATLYFSFNTEKSGDISINLPLGVIIYWIGRKKILATETKKAQAV